MENKRISDHIKDHTIKKVREIKQKPYHIRMHFVRVFTFIAGILIVLGWIILLKYELKIDPSVKEENNEKTNIISESILRVFKSEDEGVLKNK
jgi:hypothetical protein